MERGKNVHSQAQNGSQAGTESGGGELAACARSLVG